MPNEEEAEIMEGTELEEEPELFVMESLQPMLFSIRVCPEKAKLQRIVEDHGGELTSKAGGPHTLRLLPCGEKAFSTTGDIYSAQYIYDCVKQKKLLDPSKYRVNKKSCYSDDVEILDIIRGVRSWADCTRVKVDSVDEVSDFSDDEDTRQQPTKIWKTGRRPYSRKEQKAILDYIIKSKNYGFVKGNSLWKEIERKQICPNRSWESMKEHYRKVIITDLGPYHLTRKIEARLYEGYTGRKTQEESSDEDRVDSDHEEEGKENRKDNCKGSTVEKRMHGTKQEEEPVTQRESASASHDVDKAEMVRLRDKSNENSESVENENARKEEREREKSGQIDQTALDQLERQVALFDSDNNGGSQTFDINCTQAFEVDLQSNAFSKKSEIVKDLEGDWESEASFPMKGKEDIEDEKNSGLEVSSAEGMHKDASEDKSRNQITEGDAKKIAKFLVDMTDDTGETVVHQREEAEIMQDHITDVSEEETVVVDDKKGNVSDEGTLQDSPVFTNSDTHPRLTEDGEPVEDIRNSARGQQITKDLLGSFIPDTESSPDCSDVSTVLFSLDEEQNNEEGATLVKGRKRDQSKEKQIKSNSKSFPDHNSSHYSTSEDITLTRQKLRKPPKKRKNWRLSSESSTSGSEVEITRNRKVDVEQILSHSSNVGQGNRPLGNKATPQKQDSSPKRKGKASEKKTFSPRRRGKDQDQKEEEVEASESEAHDLDHSDLLESEDDLNLNVTHRSDCNFSLDTFTGRYDPSYSPSGVNKRATGRKFQWMKNYTREEDVMILDYINSQKAYGRVGGIEFWKDMEECGIIPNRSWHSLKERYRKRILPNIHVYVKFGIPKSTIPKFLKFKPTTEEEPQRAKASETYRQPYSQKEDRLILDFIIKNKRYSEVGGKTLWTLMASCEPGLKGRTWLSLKERFRKNLIKNLHSFRLSSNEIQNFQRSNNPRNKAINYKKPPPGGMLYRFGGGTKKDTKSNKGYKKLSDSEDAEDSAQEEEVSRNIQTDMSTSGKNEDLDHESTREDDKRMETTTSQESESKYSPSSHRTQRRRQSPRKDSVRLRADSPEIPVVNDTFMERKRKLFTAPEGNRVLTPMVMINMLEESNQRQQMKRRKLETTIFSDEADGGDKQKGSESEETGKRGKHEDKLDREVPGDSEDDGHNVSVDVSDTEKHTISSVEGLEHDTCSEEFQRSPEVSKLSSPGYRNVNMSRTPPPTSPKAVQRVSPRKRNEMKFKEQRSTSLSEASEVDITGVSDSHSSPDVHKTKKTKSSDARNQSFPGTSGASEQRITRRSLELQKTLPRQKLRAHALQKKR